MVFKLLSTSAWSFFQKSDNSFSQQVCLMTSLSSCQLLCLPFNTLTIPSARKQSFMMPCLQWTFYLQGQLLPTILNILSRTYFTYTFQLPAHYIAGHPVLPPCFSQTSVKNIAYTSIYTLSYTNKKEKNLARCFNLPHNGQYTSSIYVQNSLNQWSLNQRCMYYNTKFTPKSLCQLAYKTASAKANGALKQTEYL